uniref:SPC3 n=1 Tax=Pseudonaja textilis TaxID=8673 RepID=A0A670YF98_PSETE
GEAASPASPPSHPPSRLAAAALRGRAAGLQRSGCPRGSLAAAMRSLQTYLLLLAALPACLPARRPRTVHYTNHWAVRVLGGPGEADRLASAYGYLNLGQIGSLEDYYHFHHSKTIKRSTFSSRGPHNFLRMDPKVTWIQQQEVKTRVKRRVQRNHRFVSFNDPSWPEMWYMHCEDNNSECRSEMNVLGAWQRGYTGKGVVVTILDDGIERNHPDLIQNYDPHASYDVNGNDEDPTPRYDPSNENKHGTRCAGEVAASANNSNCIVGIAYNARIGGIRMLDGDVTDVVEAKAIGAKPEYIHVYSASWGPDDDGRTVDGPGPLAKQAFEHGIKKGRRGRGSIFVWASGNGGREGDHCSCDGYTNSVYTISVSSTTENGNKPWYLEECASTLATTYSSGAFYERQIMTTDLKKHCTDGFNSPSWVDTLFFPVSHLYGFGLVDAESLVVEAKRWKTVPAQHICMGTSNKKPWFIPANKTIRTMTLSSACADNSEHHVVYLEHVVVRISIVHPRRGDLQIYLTSPLGTRSQLLARRQHDDSNEGFKHWEFMTVHCWGERAAGEWTLEIQDKPYHVRNPDVQGKLKEWSLILYGTAEHPSSNISTQYFRSTISLEMEPSKVAFFQNQMEIPEEEDEYTGLCHRECGDQGCDGPNADQCLNCFHYSLGSIKTGRKCVNSCPPGYFEDSLQRKCRRCHRGCEACLDRSQNSCTACKRGYYHHQETNTCVMLCPAGFYSEDGQRRCQKCHQNCKKCFGEMDKCSVCKDGFSQEECLQCTKKVHEWRCVPTCGEGYYYDERLGVPFRVCRRCEDNCLNCDGSGRNCSRCKEGFYLLSGSCIASDRCHNGDEMFCEMVKSNKLCERKPFIQFCCRTCLLAG